MTGQPFHPDRDDVRTISFEAVEQAFFPGKEVFGGWAWDNERRTVSFIVLDRPSRIEPKVPSPSEENAA